MTSANIDIFFRTKGDLRAVEDLARSYDQLDTTTKALISGFGRLDQVSERLERAFRDNGDQLKALGRQQEKLSLASSKAALAEEERQRNLAASIAKEREIRAIRLKDFDARLKRQTEELNKRAESREKARKAREEEKKAEREIRAEKKKTEQQQKDIDRARAKAIKAQERAEKDAQRAVAKAAREREKAIARTKEQLTLLSTFVSGALLYGLQRYATRAVQLASDAEESANKFRIVFGEAADEVGAKLDQFAEAVGRNRFQLRAFAGDTGDLLEPFGFVGQELNTLSEQIVKLAVDLGSFNNLDTVDALNRVNATLIGNHENAKIFGVAITEATLKQELFRIGAENYNGAALEQAKVQARLNILLRGTVNAQGDAARSADETTNQYRALKAELEEIQTEIGLRTLPAINSLLQLTNEFLQSGGVQQGIQNFSDGLTFVTGGFNDQLEALKNVEGGADALIKAYEGINRAQTPILSAISPLTRLITPLAKLGSNKTIENQLKEIAKEATITASSTEELEESLREVFGEDLGKRVDLARNGLTSFYVETEAGNISLGSSLQLLRNSAGAALETFDNFNHGLGGTSRTIQEISEAATVSAVQAEDALLSMRQQLNELSGNDAQFFVTLSRQLDDNRSASVARALAAEREREEIRQLQEAYRSYVLDASSQSGDLASALADLRDAQGEYVTTTRDSSAELSAISRELAGDLSSDQKQAMEDILGTVTEGSAEWLAAYNALQGDLSDSQRRELIARQNDLQEAHGQAISVYNGDAEAVEEATERIRAAYQARIESYRQAAVERLIADADAERLPTLLKQLEAVGLLAEGEADLRLQYANTLEAIELQTDALLESEQMTLNEVEALALMTTGLLETQEQVDFFAASLSGPQVEAFVRSQVAGESLRDTIQRLAEQGVITKDQADKLTASLSSQLGPAFDGSAAKAGLLATEADNVTAALNRIPTEISVTFTSDTSGFKPPSGVTVGQGFAKGGSGFGGVANAQGGRVLGGVRGLDSVQSMLMPDEYVINARAAQRIGYDALDRLNRGGAAGLGGSISNRQYTDNSRVIIQQARDPQQTLRIYHQQKRQRVQRLIG